ncbi:DsrE family protein [Aurantimonas marina]|uniref:DsrE family protein n=1 Tax=Aurantimonas marina TaxID=2780508 RepID=UPI0019D080C6|nr:DsrE family protein [Aurantimonas marina]
MRCRRLLYSAPILSAIKVIAVGLCLTLMPMLAGGWTMPARAQGAEDEISFATQRLALQVSVGDEAVMRSALDIAANVSRFFSDQAEEVDIRIVVFGPGMTMLRPGMSPVLDRLKAFDQSMPNVSFAACGNTLDSLERAEGVRPEIVEYADIVVAGVAELMRLDQAGYTIVKP